MACGHNPADWSVDLAPRTGMKTGGIVIGCDKWNRRIITFSKYTPVDPHLFHALSAPDRGDKERELGRK